MTATDVKTSLPLPPGNFGLPIIGETISFLRDPDFIQKRQAKYGSVFKTHIFGRPTVVMIGSEANHFIFSHENKYFSVSWPHSTTVLLGQSSLSVQQGAEHQKNRKLLSHAFQARALAGYLPGMERLTLSYLQKWESLGTFAWYPDLRDFTFDVACELLVGTESGSQTPLRQWFNDYCDGLFSISLSLPWTKFGRAMNARKQMLGYIEKMALSRKQAENPGQDALGLLLQARDEEGNSLSLNEIKEQVLLLLFAGHETLTSALCSLCLLLAQHPEILAGVRAEQQKIYVDGSITMEQLKQMTYLEQVLKEVLRFIPPVAGAFRKVIQPCEFDGYYIPEGWGALYQIPETHLDKCVYAQPEQFDPQRFAPERAEDRQKSFSYVPFGGGARECLGKAFAQLEMKIFAAHLVRNYTWELLPNQNLELGRVPTPHPRDGLRVNFRHLQGERSHPNQLSI